MMRRSLITELLLLSVVIIWGAHYTVIKYAVLELSPAVFTLLRFMGVAPLLMLWTYWTEGSITIKSSDLVQLLIIGFFGVALYQVCYIAAAKYTTAANASLLVALSPIFTMLLSSALGFEALSLRAFIGSMLAFGGVTLVIWSSNLGLGFSLINLKGDFIAIAAAFLWGLYPLLTQPLLRRYSALRVMAMSSLAGCLFLALYSGRGLLQVDWASITTRAWLALGYAIVPATAYALVVWYSIIHRYGANRTMVYMYLVPVIAILVSLCYLDEPIYPSHLFGTLVILGGIALTRKR